MSPAFEPRDPNFAHRVRESLARQGLLTTFGAELRSVEPGSVDIEVPFSPGLTQQDDFSTPVSPPRYSTVLAATRH
jgi:acyl-coenzyme A thioesterase PaaI-like protein